MNFLNSKKNISDIGKQSGYIYIYVGIYTHTYIYSIYENVYSILIKYVYVIGKEI